MESKKTKKIYKNRDTGHAIRVCDETFKMLKDFKNLVNKTKPFGGLVSYGPILKLAVSLLKDEHAKILHKDTLKSSDRQDFFRRKYFELYNTNSDEEFIGFTMTSAYLDFIKDHEHGLFQ